MKIKLNIPREIDIKGRQQVLVVAFVILILILVPAVYFQHKYQHDQSLLKNPNAAVNAQVDQLTRKIGAHLLLPVDEQPTLAKVTDLAKLQDQPFFSQAKTGDEVLVYSLSRKAILYRPSTGKIITVAHLGVNP